jgi:hypothetical protein
MIKAVLFLLLLAGLYVGFTWFFFGASHPCEIYYRTVKRPWLDQKMRSMPSLTDDDRRELPKAIRQSVYDKLTPAQCLRYAISRDPVSDEEASEGVALGD